MKVVTSEKELKKAIQNNVNVIRIKNEELAKRVKRTLRIPNASFVAASVFISTAIAGTLITKVEAVTTGPATGWMSTVVTFSGSAAAAAAAIPIIGAKAAIALVILGVSLGGYGMVKKLHGNYKIHKSGSGWVEIKLK